MDQPLAVAFTAFVEVWPREIVADSRGDSRRPICYWCGKTLNF